MVNTTHIQTMKQNQPNPNGVNQRHSKGFTLMELMIVIAIMCLLLVLLIPAYTDPRTINIEYHIRQVDAACHIYKDAHGSFPGQSMGDTMATNSVTGSELLAEALWEPGHTPLNADGHLILSSSPSENYLPYDNSYSFWDGAVGTGDAYLGDPTSITGETDQHIDTKRALLYYPSKLGNNGVSNTSVGTAYENIDNIFYTGQNTVAGKAYLASNTLSDLIHQGSLDLPNLKMSEFKRLNNYDSFLLVASFKNPLNSQRRYFGTYDSDGKKIPYNITNTP